MNEHVERAQAIVHTHMVIRSFRGFQRDIREAAREYECTGLHAEALAEISKGLDEAIARVERFMSARGLPPESDSKAAFDAAHAAFEKAREEAGGAR